MSRLNNSILADRILIDLIDRLEGVRAALECNLSETMFIRLQILSDNALRGAIEYLVELREERLRGMK
jgi:hypothetical protein